MIDISVKYMLVMHIPNCDLGEKGGSVTITYHSHRYLCYFNSAYIRAYIFTCTLTSMVNLSLPIFKLCSHVVGLCCAVGSWFCFGFAHSCLILLTYLVLFL
jgi:hypothetical protein